jgi:adenosylcobinamide-GDP ribazoletransferase
MYRLFRQTLAFLTILPGQAGAEFNSQDLARMPGCFPLVGLVVGLISALLWLTLGALNLSDSLIAILVVTGIVVLTRGFHLDGLADSADALLSHRSVLEKLQIFKDCHLGTFGVTAIVLDLLLKINLYAMVMATPLALTAFILVPLWGRLSATVVACSSRYARPSGGLSLNLVDGSGREEMRLAVLTSVVLSIFGGWLSLVTVLWALLVGFVLTKIWTRALGGVTGDLLGATVELGEILSLGFFLTLGSCF